MKNVKILSTVAAGVLASSMSFAATDGDLGTTSTGDFLATLTINSLVLVEGLADLTIDGSAGQDTGTDFEDAATAVCFFTNNATGFSVDVDSANDTGTGFEFDDTATTPYSITIDVDSDATVDATFTADTDAAVSLAAGAWNGYSAGCDNTTDGDSTIALVVSHTDYFAATDGGTDTVTITVTPNP